MQNLSLQKWIKNIDDNLKEQIAEINRIDCILRTLECENNNSKESIFRLNFLLQLASENPPAEEMMEELLIGFPYEKVENNDYFTSYLVDGFLLTLNPGESRLFVESRHIKPFKETVTTYTLEHPFEQKEEYLCADYARRRISWRMENAKDLAEVLWRKKGKETCSGFPFFLEKMKQFIRLSNGTAYEEYTNARNEHEEAFNKYKEEQRQIFDKALYEDILCMKQSGLYKLLQKIEEDSLCDITVTYSPTSYSQWDGLSVLDDFLEKYEKKETLKNED